MPPKSKIWMYFKKIDGTSAECNICKQVLKTAGNTTNLAGHMKSKHSNVYNSTSTSEPSASILTADPDNSQILQKSVKENIQECFKTISSFTAGGDRYNKITDAILYMIYKDNEPFRIVEKQGFKHLIKTLAPLYSIPSRKTIKKLLDEKYDFVKSAFKNEILNVESVTLTCDVWTETFQTRSFLGITIHYIPINATELKSINLGLYEIKQRHTGENLAQIIDNICTEWNIEKETVTAMVTDGGANIIKAVEMTFGKSKHIYCFAHMINLICTRAVTNVKELTTIINKVKATVTWFKHSVIASDELRYALPNCNKKKLLNEVPTRWNSTFYMLERYLELRPSVNEIISKHVTAQDIVSAKECEVLREIKECPRPFEVATREMSAVKYVTGSMLIPMSKNLRDKINDVVPKSEEGLHLKESLISEWKKRFDNIEQGMPILTLSTILDPRFKELYLEDPIAIARAIKMLNNLVKSGKDGPAPESDKSDSSDNQSTEDFSLWSHHRKKVNASWKAKQRRVEDSDKSDTEIIQYLNTPCGRLGDNPLLMWKDSYRLDSPLHKIAKKYLSVIGTSVPSERLFSKAGDIITCERNRLSGKSANKIIFLGSVDDSYWGKT